MIKALTNKLVLMVLASLAILNSFSFQKIDSLWNVWDTMGHNPERIIVFDEISGLIGKNEAFNQSLQKFYSVNNHLNSEKLLEAIYSESEWWFSQLRYDHAAQYAKLALYFSNRSKKENQYITVRSLIFVAYNHKLQGDNAKAIEKLTLARKIAEDLTNESQLLSDVYFSLGGLYYDIHDFERSKEMYQIAFDISQDKNNNVQIAKANYVLGLIELELGINEADTNRFLTARDHFKESVRIGKEINLSLSILNMYLFGLANCEANMKSDLKKVPEDYFEALNNAALMNDFVWVAYLNAEIAGTYIRIGDWRQAREYAETGLKIANEHDLSKERMDNLKQLVSVYKSTNNYKKAFEYNEILNNYKDSLQIISVKETIAQKELDFEFEKKVAIAKESHRIALRDQQLLAEEKDRRSRIVILLTGIGLAITAVFAIFIFKSLKATQRQKKLLETQHRQIEKAHGEIKDSIAYAKRIQNAILPKENSLKNYFPHSFVFYRPKDIVAGDFYWIEPIAEGIFFAVADCTGHGVPGAMVSVICNGSLNRSVREHKLISPGKVLDKTRELVIQEFEKSEENVQDGMDIAICKIKNKVLHYAGANNPLWIIRNNELIEIKACKQPIGKYGKQTPFVTHSVELETNDTLYLFSDGFSDQFGGDKNKKYKSANFKKFLLSIQESSLTKQVQLIENEFNQWMGQSEQIDDVCILGVKITGAELMG